MNKFSIIIKFIFLNLILSISVQAQVGFNNHVQFDNNLMFYSKVVNINDTLYVSGQISNSTTGKTGLVLAKYDSSGVFLQSQTYFDSLGALLFFPEDGGFDKLSNGDLVVVGSMADRTANYIFIYSKELELKNYFEYEDNSVQSILQKGVLVDEEDNIYLVGSKQNFNFKTDGFVMKINSSGNLLWEKQFGFLGSDERIFDLVELEGGNIVLIGDWLFNWNNSNPINWDYKTQLRMIDTAGNELNFWEGSEMDESRAGSIGIDNEGNLIYSFRKVIYFPQDGGNRNQLWVRKVNNNYEVIWETRVDRTTVPWIDINKLIVLEDGSNLVVGGWRDTSIVEPGFGHLYGGLTKLSSEGDMIWYRLDSALIHQTQWDDNFFHGATLLSSGSIVMVGEAEAQGTLWGWIVKVDKNGCLDTLCATPTYTSTPSAPRPISVFPNPTQSEIYLSIPNASQDLLGSLSIYNASGQLVLAKTNHRSWEAIATNGLNAGMYYFLWKGRNGEEVYNGKFVKTQ